MGGRQAGPCSGRSASCGAARYELAIDFQGLLKSALLARAAGARETVGFAAGQLREPAAGVFYSRRIKADASGHVVRKNLSMVEVLGGRVRAAASPLRATESSVPGQARACLQLDAAGRFAVINPGAGWPNKHGPPTGSAPSRRICEPATGCRRS